MRSKGSLPSKHALSSATSNRTIPVTDGLCRLVWYTAQATVEPGGFLAVARDVSRSRTLSDTGRFGILGILLDLLARRPSDDARHTVGRAGRQQAISNTPESHDDIEISIIRDIGRYENRQLSAI